MDEAAFKGINESGTSTQVENAVAKQLGPLTQSLSRQNHLDAIGDYQRSATLLAKKYILDSGNTMTPEVAAEKAANDIINGL